METRRSSVAVLFGVSTIFAFAVFSSLLFSLVLAFTNLDEQAISYVVTGTTFFAMFVGGFLAGGKSKQKGLLVGGITGFIFSTFVFAFQFLGLEGMFTVQQLIYHVCFIITAMMGGVLGVNMSSQSD
ncbi:TIGR04086 family membrane protein [Bacillus fonticola]|uniref:TIGR04086 family membrane protein n=1 Tax=Bacillus fonticola TaxID=2728853 RepID=UPI001472FA8C|nr:TIGR04086 family membrane protein [Bacillus fonticola]